MGLGRLAARGLTMTDARRITVGPIAAAYLEIQQGVVLVPASAYDALQSRLDAAEQARKALEAENELLRATPAQEVRQEAVAWMLRLPDGRTTLEKAYPGWAEGEGDGYSIQPLYTTPQPGPDMRALAASLYQACGAYDMPERILDVLSAAANGEPFTHMIDGILPCVPPSDQDVSGLVEALENCAAALAWNCFGECRAVHAGPIMPAAKALDTARTALAAHRHAQQGDSNDT